MKTIWKFTLELLDTQEIRLPEDSNILSVMEQDNKPVVYAIVNPEVPKLPIIFKVRATGQPIEEDIICDYIFLGTISTYNGTLIWHIFVKEGGI